MEKNCQRCSTYFICNADDIVNCQCYSFRLEKEESDYIQLKYSDCLCGNCLDDLKKELRALLLANIKTFLN